MTTALTVFRAQVDENLGDKTSTTIYDSDARDTQIKAAVEDYSRDVPQTAAGDVTGAATRYYALTGENPSLTSWVDGVSQVTEIEYPAVTVASGDLPQYLGPDDWRDNYEAGGIAYLLLLNHTPAATEKMRITYTVPYAWSGTPEVTATPTAHFYAICALATAKCCRAIAANYANTGDSILHVDSTDHNAQYSAFLRLAEHYETAYREALGLAGDDGRVEDAAGGFVDWDTAPGWPAGRRFVYHGNR